MIDFKRWNIITGWVLFVIAAVVYLLTLEPTVSYWDCGEFIASSYKLEVNHPPGAPLFLLVAKFFSLFSPDKAKVALLMNAVSALSSAFTILFLFWTITRLGRRIFVIENNNSFKTIAILGSGLTGALAYTFSDTFWFSAVETEVYALSSLFTAIVFWSILRWEEECNQPFANRWIILIAYLIGLSIGVHLLNLLAIPAMTLVFYFRKFKPTKLGFIATVLISFIILAFVQIGIISWTLDLAFLTEIWFVNSLSMPFNSGIIAYSFVLGCLICGGIWLTYSRRKIVLHTALLAIAMIIAGYSSYFLIVIRSQANPPMNENKPDNVLSLLSYINRDQYGNTPLFYGQYYNAPVTRIVDGKAVYRKENGKYVIAYHKLEFEYNDKFKTVFPRMYSSDRSHIKVYKTWGNITGNPVSYFENKKQKTLQKPTFSENISFFLKYQVGYMYLRYFGWNFIGRQNNIDGDGGILNGNCISGFGVIDSLFYGPQSSLPDRMKKNKGRNVYYFLPFLLGLMGMFYQYRKSKRDFSVILLLFFMTGIAIVIYLNQSPLQPRERDYAYAGSFYAFAIWIGLGVLSLSEIINKQVGWKRAAVVASLASLIAVPGVMAIQNWDDHDRSGRYTAHDVAYNYLNSCAPNAILFTNGDNDTFPLWYLQEVEGVRTDVRVVNVLLLSFDWYIDQMKCKVYNSDPLPISLDHEKYKAGNCDYVYFTGDNKETMDLKDAIAYVASKDSSKKLILESGEILDCLPTNKFSFSVDKKKLISNGTVNPNLLDSILPAMHLHFSKDYIAKNELIVMDILAHNEWNRPIYYVTPNSEGSIGLGNHTQLEGFAYRLVPIYTNKEGFFRTGRIESEVMYKNMMENFRWGHMNECKVLIDDQNIQMTSILKIRVNFGRLAEKLFMVSKRDSAQKTIARCMELMPCDIYPHDIYTLSLIESAYKVQAISQAEQLTEEFANQCYNDLSYYHKMPQHLQRFVSYEELVASQAMEQLSDMTKKYDKKEFSDKIGKLYLSVVKN